MCFGLRTDFRSRLFEGSKRLMELADSIEEATGRLSGRESEDILVMFRLAKDTSRFLGHTRQSLHTVYS